MLQLSDFVNFDDMRVEIESTGKVVTRYGNGVYSDTQAININDLEIDPLYQRLCKGTSIKKIVDEFTTLIVNDLKVSERNGHYYIFDGQHTLIALKRMADKSGKPKDFLVRCTVFHGLDFKCECQLFEKQTGYTTKVSDIEKFRALIAGGNQDIINMDKIMIKYGFRIPFKHSDDEEYNYNLKHNNTNLKEIMPVKNLIEFYHKEGEEQFERLMYMLSPWNSIKEKITNQPINGIMLMLKYLVHNKGNKINDNNVNRKKEVICDIDIPLYVKTIKRIMFKSLLRKTQLNSGNITIQKAWARTLINEYNKKIINKNNELNIDKLPCKIVERKN